MPILEWILEAMLSYAVKGLVARWGHTKAGEHVIDELEHAKALYPDSDPSPASLRKPPEYNG